MNEADLIAHLTGPEHGLADSTLVASLAGTDEDSISTWLEGLHRDDHEAQVERWYQS